MFSKEVLKSAIFKWKDLDGKRFEITVGRQEGKTCVIAYELSTGVAYVLYLGGSE